MFDQRRVYRIQDRLQQEGLAALYVRDTANIQWACGFEDVFDEERAHGLLIPAWGEKLWLHTDSRYITACEQAAEGTPIQVDAKAMGFSKWAAARWQEAASEGGAGLLALEDSISLAEYRALEEAFVGSCSFAETKGFVLELRAQKDAEEIRCMQAAQAVTDAAFAHIVSFMEAGMTEREVQLELDLWMLSHGAEALAFPTIVASGPNGASPHAVVSSRCLEPGDAVVMDFGARVSGYCSDMTRTVFIGEPTEQMQAAWETLRAANETVEATLRPGMTGKAAHELACAVLEEGGFGGRMGHGLGHGMGLQIHEEPVLSPRNESPLGVGNVVTVEPGIYLPGQFGMRLEDLGVIGPEGFQRFTASTHELIVL